MLAVDVAVAGDAVEDAECFAVHGVPALLGMVGCLDVPTLK
jgi:hypothetical protein